MLLQNEIMILNCSKYRNKFDIYIITMKKVIKEVNYSVIWYFKTTIKIIFKRRTNDNLSFS